MLVLLPGLSMFSSPDDFPALWMRRWLSPVPTPHLAQARSSPTSPINHPYLAILSTPLFRVYITMTTEMLSRLSSDFSLPACFISPRANSCLSPWVTTCSLLTHLATDCPSPWMCPGQQPTSPFWNPLSCGHISILG